MYLLICRFKIDANYVGDPPSIEVTIFHLNDNIDKQFLKDMVQKFGVVEELFIYYHPQTNKHLGIGRVVFECVESAKDCVEKLNDTSVMGKKLEVFLDPFGEKCKKTFEDYTVEKKPVATVESTTKIEEKKVEEEKKVDKEKESKDAADDNKIKKDRERDRDRYNRVYRNDFPTPSSSDMGYGTASSDFSTNYGSAGTTPLTYEYGHNIALPPQYPYATPTYHPMSAPPVWPIATPQWPSDMWERTPAGLVPPKYSDKDPPTKDHKDKEKKRNNNIISSTKTKTEKEKEVENAKTLDLDTRIALLLKGRSGDMAPPFLSLGGESDDESKSSFDKISKPIPIPTSIDSDDGL